MIALSAAFLTPTPIWVGARPLTCARATGVDSKTLPTKRRRVSPTATGRTPPSALRKGVRLAPHNQGACSCGSWPFTHRQENVAKALSRDMPTPGRLRQSARWLGRSPLGPAALPLGKRWMASRTKFSQYPSESRSPKPGSRAVGNETGMAPLGAGCKACSLARTAGSSGSCDPELRRRFSALRLAPSATSDFTLRSRSGAIPPCSEAPRLCRFRARVSGPWDWPVPLERSPTNSSHSSVMCSCWKDVNRDLSTDLK